MQAKASTRGATLFEAFVCLFAVLGLGTLVLQSIRPSLAGVIHCVVSRIAALVGGGPSRPEACSALPSSALSAPSPKPAVVGERVRYRTVPNPSLSPLRSDPHSAPRTELLRKLCKTGGGATASDCDPVVDVLRRLPYFAVTLFRQFHTQVVVVDRSPVQAFPDLHGQRPRGWPVGSVWDTTDGVYDPPTRQVVVVVKDGFFPRGYNVPGVLLHEMGHALDHAIRVHHIVEYGGDNGGSRDPAFLDARNTCSSTLSEYDLQPGDAGPEETYATFSALYFDGWRLDGSQGGYKLEGLPTIYRCPQLHAYFDRLWASNPRYLDSLSSSWSRFLSAP
jgi:hypothetical protein